MSTPLPVVEEQREMSVPLTVEQWAKVFDCTEEEALKRLENMEKSGDAVSVAEEPRAERCETCRFWATPHEVEGEKDLNVELEPEGECHRYPPQIDDEAHLAVKFPPTGPRCWCGEWQAKGGAASGTKSGFDSTPIIELNLPIQICNALESERIATAGDLVRMSGSQLLSVRNIGKGSLVKIGHALAKRGLRLRDE